MQIALLLTGVVLIAWAIAASLPWFMTTAIDSLAPWLEPQRSMLGRVSARIFGAGRADLPLLAVLAVMTLFGTWGFFALLEDVVMGDPIIGLDRRIYEWLQTLRGPVLDRVMIGITGLGDPLVFSSIGLAVMALAVGLRRWDAALLLIVSIAGSAVFVGGVKRVIQRPRPVAVYDGLATYSFPSGHAAMSVTLFGVLAVLLIRASTAPWHRRITFVFLLTVAMISISRIYLGAHWFSDVAAGLAFGAAWVALLSIFYIRSGPEPIAVSVLAPVILVAAVAASLWHGNRDGAAEARRYARPAVLAPQTAIPAAAKMP